ncbi:unnamed protein product [Rodentolepis nana]|uniref:Uncharacterized protein n=1 Tax=Rodentolepis nana TaxID=102285 RepID=A0A0R3T6G6_RODNA|nr:unnamed protein product [Rodentolepis nana]
MTQERRRSVPSLMSTNLEIRAPQKTENARQNYIVPCGPTKESELKLPDKYLFAPHLTRLSQSERKEIEKICPSIYPHDSWARIPWNKYADTTAPTELYTTSLSHFYYSDPLPGKRAPIIYK